MAKAAIRPKDVENLPRVEDISDLYGSVMSASASSRRYLDIEPNISVRDEYTRDDYYGFRPSEYTQTQSKKLMTKCAQAYDNVGLIKQVIDLMGDFASQGIRISHTSKPIERFYRRWWEKVNGSERSERFLNYLYRLGNVVVYKSTGKITKKNQKDMSKAAVRTIPFRYDFLNPMIVEVDGDYSDIFGAGFVNYKIQVSQKTKESINKRKDKKAYLENLDPAAKKALMKGSDWIPLDEERLHVAHYKKDDWNPWANPMIHAILDDINMMEKMKLADMSALDGAISNIRLWVLGDLEHKILPTKAAITKLRDVLASNVGGGTMDLVWGPELTFKESNSQVYKFLGNEKYGPVLNAIYGGLGVPQTMTGSSGGGGGFTNNFLSLKTLIEKLEYGRDLLVNFWREEFEDVAEAMGFPTPAELRFDNMILSDEAAEKNLWIQLSDRYIISDETLRERFGESNAIEESRIAKENKDRKKGKTPTKSDPFHNGNTESEYVKLALQKDTLSIEDVTEHKARKPPVIPGAGPPQTKKPVNKNGRPPQKKDTTVRKQRRVLPKSKADIANIIMWAEEAQKRIAAILNPALLSQYQCKSLRELTTAQHAELEQIKFVALCGISPYTEISPDVVADSLDRKIQADYVPFYRNFLDQNKREPSMDELRSIYRIAYSCEDF
jgi:hypothetical protein